MSSPTGMPWSKHGNVEVLINVKNLRIEVLYIHDYMYISFFLHTYIYICVNMYVMYILFVYIRIFIYIFNITPEVHDMHVVL